LSVFRDLDYNSARSPEILYDAEEYVPLYEYECKPNKHRFEVRHGMNEDPVHVCPECGGDVRRIINAVGIVFKGSGFYATDSRKSSSSAGTADEKAKADGGTAGGDKREGGGDKVGSADKGASADKGDSGSASTGGDKSGSGEKAGAKSSD